MEKEFYSTNEAAKILRTTRITIFRKIRAGEINGMKIGRNYVIPRDAISKALGKSLGIEKRIAIEKAIGKAMGDYKETFKMLGRE